MRKAKPRMLKPTNQNSVDELADVQNDTPAQTVITESTKEITSAAIVSPNESRCEWRGTNLE